MFLSSGDMNADVGNALIPDKKSGEDEQRSVRYEPAFFTGFLLRRRIRAYLLRCAPASAASLRNLVRKAG
jgi:hypothetical protein